MTKLKIIAGPCVIENEINCYNVAEKMLNLSIIYDFDYIFKSSFDKANRSSITSFRSISKAIDILSEVKRRYEIPITTDIHVPEQANFVSDYVDIIQIPAMLSRQIDLIKAAVEYGKVVNIKKGQTMGPKEVENIVNNVKIINPKKELWITERGTFFGYNNLVNDFKSLRVMKDNGVKTLIFDITHSCQEPAKLGIKSGGDREFAPLLGRAAIASGYVDGLFMEVHPNPEKAKSDATIQQKLSDVEEEIKKYIDLWNLKESW